MCKLSGDYGDFKVTDTSVSHIITKKESDKRLCRIRKKDGGVELDPEIKNLNEDEFSSFKFLLTVATSN